MFCGRDYTVGTTEENRREGKPKGGKGGSKTLIDFHRDLYRQLPRYIVFDRGKNQRKRYNFRV